MFVISEGSPTTDGIGCRFVQASRAWCRSGEGEGEEEGTDCYAPAASFPSLAFTVDTRTRIWRIFCS